jgi:hypothetical protein
LAAREHVVWSEILLLARTGGVAPLLYHTTRGQELLPPSVADKLRLAYFQTARANLVRLHELEHVLRSLSAANIPVILLKGIALADVVYGNVAVRPMSDIDLLVREANVAGALRALTTMGYRAIPPRAYRCEVMLHKEEGRATPIELHWSLFVPFFYQHTLSEDWLWETALAVDIGDTSTWMLGPEAQLLHLCGHLMLHHGSTGTVRDLWLYDVAAVIDRYREVLDWEDMLRRAQTYGLVLALQRVLRRASDVWQPSIPSYVLERLDALKPSPEEQRAVSALTEPKRSASQSFLSELAALPAYGPRLRFVWRNLFPPPGYLEQIYGVPHRLLVPFAYPYRWLRALMSLLRR